jgi:hypothetical protein
MGARKQAGIGLSYRPASLCSLATQFLTRFLELIPRPKTGLKFSTQNLPSLLLAGLRHLIVGEDAAEAVDLPEDEEAGVLALPVAEVRGQGEQVLVEALHGRLLQCEVYIFVAKYGMSSVADSGSGIRNRFFSDPGPRITDPKPKFLIT